MKVSCFICNVNENYRYVDLLLRIKELENWTADFQLPAAIWLGGFFNPQSFLTAIMQVKETISY